MVKKFGKEGRRDTIGDKRNFFSFANEKLL